MPIKHKMAFPWPCHMNLHIWGCHSLKYVPRPVLGHYFGKLFNREIHLKMGLGWRPCRESKSNGVHQFKFVHAIVLITKSKSKLSFLTRPQISKFSRIVGCCDIARISCQNGGSLDLSISSADEEEAPGGGGKHLLTTTLLWRSTCTLCTGWQGVGRLGLF